MPTTRSNQGQAPVNADTFNLTGDLAKLVDSMQVVVTVANQAAGDAVASARAAAGFAVTDARPLFCWDQSQNALIVKGSSGWRGGVKPFGHMGKTNGFTAGTDQNPVTGMAAQILRGGMTFSSADNALVVPLTGYYRISGKAYTSGGATGGSLWNILQNTTTETGSSMWWTKTQVDEMLPFPTIVRQLTAGDKISMRARQPASVWGASGYDGTFLEVEYMDQW